MGYVVGAMAVVAYGGSVSGTWAFYKGVEADVAWFFGAWYGTHADEAGD